MSDNASLLERLSVRATASDVHEADDDVFELTQEERPHPSQKAFTLVRGVRQLVPMLELRLGNGNSVALGYSYLVSLVFNPSEGVVLEFTTHKVAVQGRNLRPLYAGLRRHLVTRVCECSGAESLAVGEGISCVTGIAVKPNG